ncbi:MAG: DUF1573 domain-containing protein [Bacteroidota bacterium]
MEKSKQIQIGLLGLIAVLLLVNLFTGGLFGGSADAAKDAARQRVAVNNPATPANTVTPTTPAAPPVPAGPTTSMEFAESTFDFGTVEDGEKVSHVYKFTNTGNEPLIISDAKGSCGCTVPSKPTEPIPPGETGEITVEFNSKNKKGKRNQKVTITANTNPPQTVISLTGEVLPPAGAEASK